MPMPVPSRPQWKSTLATSLPKGVWRTRFAPAPTGFLHLGHLVNAIHVWGIARAHGGRVLLRLEDHDRTRCRPEYEQALLDDLEWLGLTPDDFDTTSFRNNLVSHHARQSNQHRRYASALQQLAAHGMVYGCRCTRKDIAQQVPHSAGTEARYPGTCRALELSDTDTYAKRVRLETRAFHFDDLRLGAIGQTPADQCGDLLVRDRHAQWTYQFAVVVDDMTHGIDVVIRGEDLLESTGRQLQLAELLGRTAPPRFLHHTLLVHPDGSKLSKATHDTSLRDMRTAGARPDELLGLAARRAGLGDMQRLSAADIPSLFV
ncbi:glutamate--tRNA ligase family protein [Gemmatimonas sp.]|uniref:glutamate--tRNA ligase family protein n=1 Tax=Gemmatimonas sp. TaxID=1962908 RepID=UPI0031BDEE85|nr:hypothetical protein [Gemmatimonas sp.]